MEVISYISYDFQASLKSERGCYFIVLSQLTLSECFLVTQIFVYDQCYLLIVFTPGLPNQVRMCPLFSKLKCEPLLQTVLDCLGVHLKVRQTDLETKKGHTKIWIEEVKQEIYNLVYALKGKHTICLIVVQSKPKLCILRNGIGKARTYRDLQTCDIGLQKWGTVIFLLSLHGKIRTSKTEAPE